MIRIEKFKLNHIPYKVKWINDEKNNKYLHYDLPLEVDKTIKWFQKNVGNKNRLDYTILYDDIPVGLIGLLNIDYKNKKAEYYVLLGEHQFKHKNIAYEASKQLIRLAKEIKINKIYLYTEVDNIPAQKLFAKIGFKKEGRLNQDIYYNGNKIDRYVYGMILNE